MSKIILTVILTVVAVVLYLILYMSFPQAESPDNNRFRFEAWKSQHAKNYLPEEEDYRFNIFVQALEHIQEYNSQQTGVVLEINKFADLTNQEFDILYKGYIPREEEEAETELIPVDTANLPDSVDWRTKSAVTYVKDQGQCGSCWAFSTVFSLEGIYAIKNGKLLSFSEQQLVDCSLLNLGCSGGNTGTAMDYEQGHGTILESEYPYFARKGVCETKGKTVVFKPKSHTKVQPKNNDELAEAVVKQPVSVCIEADTSVFQYYRGGVIKDKACGTKLDHCVGLAGYVNDESAGGPYWIVKNSWGTSWGEKGYVRILKETGKSDGICGIAKDAIYPNYE